MAGRGRALGPPLTRPAPRVESYAALAAPSRPALLVRTRLVAVDGRGAPGKATFADRLVAALGGAPGVPHDPGTEYVRLR